MTGLYNLAALLEPIKPRETAEKAMILITRKYAYHHKTDEINKNNLDIDIDIDDDDDSDIDVSDKEETEEAAESGEKKKKKKKTEETKYLICSYYHTISQYSDVACKSGVRRACVLLGTNGTYNSIIRN